MRAPAITYGLFPLTFVGAMVAAAIGHRQGVSPSLLLAGITGATIAIIAVFERAQPHYPNWNVARGDVGTDLTHALVSMITLPPLIELGVRAAILELSVTAASLSPVAIWPHHWPVAAQLALALIVSQLGEYWVHRLAHTNPWLWRLHATHHSPERLYWLNAARFHPLDTALSFTVAMTPMVVLGVGDEVMLMMTAWISVHGLFQHCNIHLRLGPLNYIFSMAELHRWHHSKKLEEANANYGNNIIFWDIVFRTLHYPKDREAEETIGLADMPNFPKGWFGQVLSPFRWKQISG